MLKILKKVFKICPLALTYVILNHIINGFLIAGNLYVTVHIIESAFDFINNEAGIQPVITYSLYFLGLILISRILEYFYAITMNGYLYEKTGKELKYEMGKKLINLDLLKFEDRDFLTNIQRAHKALDDEIISTCAHTYARILGHVFTIVLIIISLGSYSTKLIYLAILTTVPYLITRLIRGKAFYDLKSIQAFDQRKLEYFYSLFTDTKTNREIKINDSADFFLNKYRNVFHSMSADYFKEKTKDARQLLFCDILNVISYSLALFITVNLARKGQIQIGMMGAALIAYKEMQDASKYIISSLGNLPSRLAFANDYMNFIGQDLDDKDYCLAFDGIKLEDVSFSYPHSENGIKDVDIKINKGESLAVVGENGSGKTTFSKVLTGIYSSNGNIYAGNNKYGEDALSLDDFSIVPQTRTVSNLTVGEHVGASLDYDPVRVKDCLTYVGLTKLANDQMLTTRLGKDFAGIELSGGERERLDIARSLYKNADLIILDEPTSALDPMEESRILKQFLQVSKNKTSIIISHRIGICRFVDRVAVFKDGRLIGLDDHDSLMETCPYYKDMYLAQSKFYN